MADVIRTIGSITGDESTVGDAVTWLQNAANYSHATDDLGYLRIVDAEQFNESITLGGFTGTPSASSYVVLEASISVSHTGEWDSSRANITNGSSDPIRISDEDYVHIRYMQVQVTGSVNATAIIFSNNAADNLLVEKTILVCDSTHSDADCFAGNVTGSNSRTYTLFDVAAVGNANNGQVTFHGSYDTSTGVWHIGHCTFDANGAESGVQFDAAPTSSGQLNVHNSCAFDADARSDWDQFWQGTMSGAGVISSDTSATGEFGSGNGNANNVSLTDSDQSGDIHLVTDLTDGSENYQLIAATIGTNIAAGNAQTGGTIDSRVDLTVDIAGNPRPGVFTSRDCGAFQLVDTAGIRKFQLAKQP